MTNLDLSTLISLIDLTSLNENDDEQHIIHLCQKAATPWGEVAAVCVYPRFVKLARTYLDTMLVKTAAVSNFPKGDQSLDATIKEIENAINAGAEEIDVVIPYSAYLNNDRKYAQNFIAACKSTCGEKVILKAILETGVLKHEPFIAIASKDAINGGVDFIKTSTGKYPVGATLATAKIMLKAIRESEYDVGFKVSGGVHTLEQAQAYIQLAQSMLGEHWVTPQSFRIGASQLLDVILAQHPSIPKAFTTPQQTI